MSAGKLRTRVSIPPPCSALTYRPWYCSAIFMVRSPGVDRPTHGSQYFATRTTEPIDLDTRGFDLRIAIHQLTHVTGAITGIHQSRSISGARQRSGKRQISLDTFGGTGTSCNCSRSTAEQYFVPLLTWIALMSWAPRARTSNTPRLAPARVQR